MSSSESRCWQDLFNRSVLKSWYSSGGWTRVLFPLAGLYRFVANRQKARKLSNPARWKPPVPVLIVGNITVGGTGKTPFVASLIKVLQHKGYKPGIASRGFGSDNLDYPVYVKPSSNPALVGDEPVMLAKQLNIPLVVDPDRVSAAKALVDQFDCNLIVADDGLQHYNLDRHIEIVIIDGQRMLGNGFNIPAGPLREKPARLTEVDQILINGKPAAALDYQHDSFYLEPGALVPVSDSVVEPAPKQGLVHGVAGIGNPERFFQTLRNLGFAVLPHSFPDHHSFKAEDIGFDDDLPVIMTAKDAVKCSDFASEKHWYLPVEAKVSDAVFDRILRLIETKGPQQRLDKDDHG